MDQLLRLNEETLKWHVLCQLLSSSVLERLLKTLYEVCPSFNADTPVVARLYHETEQACLDVVKNFILIGEANRLLQGSSGIPGQQNNALKPRPVAEAQPMRRLAPKPLNQLFKSEVMGSPTKQQVVENGDKQPNPAWVSQINQNIQLQLKQLNSQVNQSSPSSSRVGTPSSPSPGPLSQLPAANGPISQLPATSTGPLSQLPLYTPTSAPVSSLVSTPVTNRQSPGTITSTLSPEATQALTAQLTAHLNRQEEKPVTPEVTPQKDATASPAPAPAPAETPQQNGVLKQGEVQKFEKQVSELKNYMDEVKALFDVFNDPSPRNKEAVNALSQAISVNSAVTQELQNIIKPDPELQVPQQQFNPLPVSHYFPIDQLMKQHQEAETPQTVAVTAVPTHTHTKGRSSKEKLNCKDCGQMFQYSYQMERHIATRHSYIKKIICDICKKTFGSPGALKRHHETIHQKIKRFTCEHCGKKFGRKDHMKFHISTVHTQKKEAPIDQSILDAAITNATTSTELRKPDDPLDELKQRIRDMSENHAREINLQQQLQQQQLHQQQLQQHILAQHQQVQQQQQTFDIQNVINSINQEILKTSTAAANPTQINGSHTETLPTSSPQITTSNGVTHTENFQLAEGIAHSEGVQQVDIEMDEDSVQVDVLEESSNGVTAPYTSSPYNSEVMKETTVVSAPAAPTHVTVTWRADISPYSLSKHSVFKCTEVFKRFHVFVLHRSASPCRVNELDSLFWVFR